MGRDWFVRAAVASALLLGCGSGESEPGAVPASGARETEGSAGSWGLASVEGAVRVALDEAPTLALRTVGVARGERVEQLTPQRDNTAAVLTLRRQDCAEEVVESRGVVEQRWRFANRPEGQGDVVVRVAIDGADFVATRGDGSYFRTLRGVSLRYSHATWVDADGARTAVEGEWDGAAVVMRVPAAVIEGSRYPAVLDPTLQVAIIPAPTPGDGNPTLTSRSFAMATSRDGRVGVAVWADRRVAPTPSEGQTSPSSVYGVFYVRFDPSTGRLIDPVGAALLPRNAFATSGSFGTVSVAATAGATGFLVSVASTTQLRLFALPFDGASPRELTPVQQASASVQSGGVACLDAVCLAVASVSGAVLAARYDASTFTVLDATPATIGPEGWYVSAGQNGREFLVCTGMNPRCARVPSDRTVPLDTPWAPMSLGGFAYAPPSILGDASAWYVAVNRSLNGTVTNGTVMLAQLDHATLATVGAARTFGSPLRLAPVAMARVGDELGVAWTPESSGIGSYLLARVNARTGATIDSGRSIATTRFASQMLPTLAALPDRWLAGSVCSEVGGSVRWPRAVRVTGGVAPTDDNVIDLGRTGGNQTQPDAAFDGTHALIVWRELRADGPGIFAARVRASDGGVVDAPAVRVSPPGGPVGCPNVAYGAETWFVTWLEANTCNSNAPLRGRRLRGSDLAPLDVAPLSLVPAGMTSVQAFTQERVGYDGDTFVALLSHTAGLYLMRVRPADGVVTTPTGEFFAPNAAPLAAANLVCGSAGCVTYSRAGGSSSSSPISLGVRGLPGGLERVNETYSGYQLRVAVHGLDVHSVLATNEVPSIFAVNRLTLASAGGDVVSRSRGSGVSLGVITRTLMAVDASRRVVFGGQNGNRFKLWDASDGALVPASGFAVSSPTLAFIDNLGGDLVNVGSDRTLALWSEFDVASPYVTERLRGAIVGAAMSVSPNGAACSSASECQSGFCVDRVCCSTACGDSASDDCMACSTTAGGSSNGTCTPLPSGRVCRPGHGVCDPEETCTGTSSFCPADVLRRDGTACSDGLRCNGAEVCMSGVCTPGVPLCDDRNPCTLDTCTEPSVCRSTPIPGCGDAGAMTDGSATTDLGSPADVAAMTDLGVTTDVGAMSDVGSPTDVGTATDLGVMTDVGVARDTGPARDAGTARDTGAANDVAAEDVNVIEDAASPDAGVANDVATADDLGATADAAGTTPTGGATASCGCAIPGRSRNDASPLALLSLAGLLARRRRSTAKVG